MNSDIIEQIKFKINQLTLNDKYSSNYNKVQDYIDLIGGIKSLYIRLSEEHRNRLDIEYSHLLDVVYNN